MNSNYQHTNSFGTTYYLNCKDVTLRGGKLQRIYFFSKNERPDTACPLPDGFTVVENKRNGFLVLRKG